MIKSFIKENPEGVVAKAYEFAKKAHNGQKRLTGEPYFNHLIATAEQLIKWKLDDICIAAGLLHDVLEDIKVSKEELLKNFGEEVLFLVEGVSKLGKVKFRGVETQVENLRKMILALSQDIRVVLIKLADRLHNMKTLSALPIRKQKRIALETAEIYAPLAYRLGMQNLSGELEDLAFPFIYPEDHRKLLEEVKDKFEEREKYLRKVQLVTEEALEKNNIKPKEINFRAKRYFSLYKKIKRDKKELSQVYDLVAFRIIVKTIEECYATLGVIHSFWPPLPGRIKDYIAMPKPNGYRSLHTTVFCLNGKITEFQIRTEEMHEEAENGIAAHWIYKSLDKKDVLNSMREMEWIKQLKEWHNKISAPADFIKDLKIEFFKDRIFAITPKGEVKDLPAGATPVDFAYQIHSKIGDEAVGAKVNGKIVPLNYVLSSGDLVEILKQKGKKPSPDWLEFVKTNMAREHIRQATKRKGLKNKNKNF